MFTILSEFQTLNFENNKFSDIIQLKFFSLERLEEMEIIIKRYLLYTIAIFFLSSGVSLSILADFGVSPVSALGYALSLVTGFSVGLMTFVTNIVYLLFQDLLNKSIDIRENIIQLIMSVLFGLFVNLTLDGFRIILPEEPGIFLRAVFLTSSLFIIALGLFFLFTSKLPVLPYDGLIAALNQSLSWNMGRAKVTGDLTNVSVAAALCLVFLHYLGSIGIGTLISAVFIGKILGLLMKKFRHRIIDWIEKKRVEKAEGMSAGNR